MEGVVNILVRQVKGDDLAVAGVSRFDKTASGAWTLPGSLIVVAIPAVLAGVVTLHPEF
jgi:hypothetical protein